MQRDDQAISDAPAKQDPLVGTILADKYEIEARHGAGGMSVVYKARHKWMKKTVAVKMLLSERLHKSSNIARFQQEARAAGALSHPNLMTVYDLGVTPEGVPFIVMEFVEGIGLDEVIERDGKLAPERCLNLFLQACEGLAAAHDKGIVHRDIKPSNVMITAGRDGAELVKIVDFGIAKLLPTEGEEALRLTQTGESFGSPLYMSPEQCLAQPQDARSDIYSMGCLMYEALTGSPPLTGRSTLETMTKHLEEVPHGLPDGVGNARLREQLEAILFKAMAKEPERRFQTMDELGKAIKLVQSGGAGGLWGRLHDWWEISRLKRVPRRARSALVAGLAMAVIALLALSAWSLSAQFRSPVNRFVEMSWVRTPEPPPPRPPDYERRERMANMMVAMVIGKQGEESAALIDRVTAVGRFRMQHHNWTGAVVCFQRALWNAKKRGLAESIDYYLTQIALADCFYELGLYKDAVRPYQEALNRMQALGLDTELAVPIGKLGDIYLRLGNLSQAKTYLNISLIRWRGDRLEGEVVLEGTPPAQNQEYALTVSRLADVYRLEGSLDQAQKMYSQAIDIWKKLEIEGAKKNLSHCLYYLGEVQRLQGHEQEAAGSYKEALAVAQDAFGRQDPYVANILYRYSVVLWHQNHWFESLDLKTKANAIRKKG